MTLLETAIGYAMRFGWSVHPVNTKKQPITPHGRNDATRDEQAIRKLFRNGAQIGVATGVESNLFVLDIDFDKERGINGYETLEYLESIHGKLPATPCQQTGRGGRQYLFKHVAGLKNSTGKIGAGVDTRGEGGYIVAAPSRNSNGPYEWLVSPDDCPLADPPQWIIEALKEAEQPHAQPTNSNERTYCQKMLGQAVARVATAPDGQKHEMLLKMARWLGGFVPTLNEAEIESALFASIEMRADDHRNARKTIRDGIAYGKAQPLDPPKQRSTTSVSEALTKRTQEAKPLGEFLEMAESQIIVERLAALGFTFRLNVCTDSVEVNGKKISDITAAEIRVALRDNGMRKLIPAAEDAYIAAAKSNAYHPIHEYLNSLIWDGQDHILRFTDYMESGDPPIVYQNGESMPLHAVYYYRWFIGAVAKALDQHQLPMLVLDGKQNIGKSSQVRWICPLPDYFVEGPIRIDDKDTNLRLMDRWIWEVSELDATTRKADHSALKDFITKKEPTVRKSYGRYEITKPALSAMIGTVNNSTGFLSDETGTRRFMVTRLTKIDFRYQDMDVNQIWAQAVSLYRQGITWKLMGEECQTQESVNKLYEVESTLSDWLDRYFIFNSESDDERLSIADILVEMSEGYRPSGSERAQAMELARILTNKGARRVHTREGKRWIGLYRKPS